VYRHKPQFQAVKSFLCELWPDGLASGNWIGISWKGSTERFQTRFFANLSHAAIFATRQAHRNNVWMSCGLSPTEPPKNRRAKANQVFIVPGFWMDIDFGVEGHQEKSYPPTRESAYRLLDAVPKPTLIVESGHGLQVWWLFENAYELNDAGAKQRYIDLSQKLQQLVADAARSTGWKLDSVHDLARVMRPVGTLNHKVPDDVKSVTVASERGPRWFIDDIDMELTAGTARVPEATSVPAPVEERTSANCQNTDEGPSSPPWPDLSDSSLAKLLLAGDLLDYPSASERDAAMAKISVNKGATKEQVGYLIHRRRLAAAENPAKALRNDYVQKTYEFALNNDTPAQQHPSATMLSNISFVLERLITSGEPPSVPSALLLMAHRARGTAFLGTRSELAKILNVAGRTVTRAWTRLQELDLIRPINAHPSNGRAKGWILLIDRKVTD
jgi:hypothetical protein